MDGKESFKGEEFTDPGYAQGTLQLPGQEGEEGQEEQGQEQEEIVVCDTWGMLIPIVVYHANNALPQVEHDPATFLAFKNLIQLLGYINARAGWMEL